MTTPWMPSPYGASTPVIDAVVARTPAQSPVPIPGYVPLPVSNVFLGGAQMPAPLMAAQPPVTPFLGVQQPFAPFGFQPILAPPVSAWPLPTHLMGMQQPLAALGMQQPLAALGAQIPVAHLQGMQQPLAPLGIQPLVTPGFGLWPLAAHQMGIHQQLPIPWWATQPALTAGPGISAAPLPITGPGGYAPSLITTTLLTQLGLREAVSRIGDEALKERVINGVNEAIDRCIESVSGMTLHPWFGPGAQFMIYPVVSELALIAHSYPEGPVRHELLNIAGQILNKSIAPAGEAGGRRR